MPGGVAMRSTSPSARVGCRLRARCSTEALATPSRLVPLLDARALGWVSRVAGARSRAGSVGVDERVCHRGEAEFHGEADDAGVREVQLKHPVAGGPDAAAGGMPVR